MREREEKAYRYYVTDAFFALVNRNMRLTKSYREIMNPVQEKEEDPQEIIDRIMAKLKGGAAD